MLQHFVGFYELERHTSQANMAAECDLLHSLPDFKKFISNDRRFLIFASRFEHPTQDQAIETNQRLLALAGYPYIYDGAGDGQKLCTMDNTTLKSVLKIANGTFALVAYESNSGVLLATDCLGARPLYYSFHDEKIYFSTSFSLMIKFCPAVHKMNRNALAEQIAFCYPLGSKTLSSEISVLRDGECLIADDDGYRTERYHDWRSFPLVKRNLSEELKACGEAFREAVRSRITPQETQLGLLSGGLDSRMIVARLREEGMSVIASNCSMPGTLDEQLCDDFAEAADVKVLHVPWTPDLLGVSMGRTTSLMLKKALSGLPSGNVFSGDGGGELFGFLMMSKKLLKTLEIEGVEEVINHLPGQEGLSRHVVISKFAKEMENLASQGVASEFKEMRDLPKEKAMQLFFILNDLRCHLHDYFGSLDSEARELLLPFYDRRVLASVIKISPPFNQYIGHQFYYELHPLISPLMNTVAWQAYPESSPCPVPLKRNGITQWKAVKQVNSLRRSYWRKRAIVSIFNSKPIDFVRYRSVILAILIDFFPSQDYSYIFKQYLALEDAFLSIS